MTKLWDALDIMREGGHSKGIWRLIGKPDSRHRPHCAIGALAEAFGQNMRLVQLEMLEPDLSHLASVAKEAFPDRVKERAGSYHLTVSGNVTPKGNPQSLWDIDCVVAVNDHPDTTQADVELMLEKAAIRADEVISA